MDVLQQHRNRRRPGEGRRPHQHLVGHDSEAVDIAPMVGGLAECLLGRHVVRRSGDDPGLCERHSAAPLIWASPKSATHAVPERSSRMFAGLTSRWTTPRPCA